MVILKETIKDYLEQNGTYPVYESEEGKAYYKDTIQLFTLLDRYYIQRVCIPNKL